jgi:hypothetical protein
MKTAEEILDSGMAKMAVLEKRIERSKSPRAFKLMLKFIRITNHLESVSGCNIDELYYDFKRRNEHL